MAQKTLDKISRKISKLEKEVKILRSFIIGSLKDPEGEYNPKFVREVLELAKEKPEFVFKNAKSFIEEVKNIS